MNPETPQPTPEQAPQPAPQPVAPQPPQQPAPKSSTKTLILVLSLVGGFLILGFIALVVFFAVNLTKAGEESAERSANNTQTITSAVKAASPRIDNAIITTNLNGFATDLFVELELNVEGEMTEQELSAIIEAIEANNYLESDNFTLYVYVGEKDNWEALDLKPAATALNLDYTRQGAGIYVFGN